MLLKTCIESCMKSKVQNSMYRTWLNNGELGNVPFLPHINHVFQFKPSLRHSLFVTSILKASLNSSSFHAFVDFAADEVGSYGTLSWIIQGLPAQLLMETSYIRVPWYPGLRLLPRYFRLLKLNALTASVGHDAGNISGYHSGLSQLFRLWAVSPFQGKFSQLPQSNYSAPYYPAVQL